MNLFLLAVVLAALLPICSSCGFLGGGGGGCCMSSCGCGGRKKRSTEEASEFSGIQSSDEDMLCNSPDLKKLMTTNMRSSAVESSKSLQLALEYEDLGRFVVVCSQAPFAYTVKADTAYCGARNGSHYCQAFAI
ncbi:unnamed protein product [Caenorhabditis auriculariae]|uniref:Ground-like domain-containing protein n=1 Tax=Caenorhabditis auriculariae TaxID=2777116 RepID=A0A8S1HC45_9PELO|nr:unnamed protein product [Caenorhabditis auriculariae]